jgi:hypothetical protein
VPAVYPTARTANWPGRQYTNLVRIPQAAASWVLLEVFVCPLYDQVMVKDSLPTHRGALAPAGITGSKSAEGCSASCRIVLVAATNSWLVA